MRHYAKDVWYKCEDWAEKNCDRLLPNVADALEGTQSDFVKSILGDIGKSSNIGKAFLRSLDSLINGNLKADKCVHRPVAALTTHSLQHLQHTTRHGSPMCFVAVSAGSCAA